MITMEKNLIETDDSAGRLAVSDIDARPLADLGLIQLICEEMPRRKVPTS